MAIDFALREELTAILVEELAAVGSDRELQRIIGGELAPPSVEGAQLARFYDQADHHQQVALIAVMVAMRGEK